VHALLQHTPSTQNPDPHSMSLAQAAAMVFWTAQLPPWQ
jgi:hypothetical protein